ncbi:MAG: hypothetical protein JWR02_1543 [Mucilaginibacter sp.]|nr:hypothetical protein [Mucilaginibacter sp.]
MAKQKLGYNSKETKATVNQILDRLKQVLSVKTDTQLGNMLLVKANTVSSWRDRNSMDFTRIFAICERENIDLNYIIFDKTNISEEVKASKRQMLQMIAQHELRMESFIEALDRLVPAEILDRLKQLVNVDMRLAEIDAADADNLTIPTKWLHVFLDYVEDNYPKKTYDNIREVFFTTLSTVVAGKAGNADIIKKLAG